MSDASDTRRGGHFAPRDEGRPASSDPTTPESPSGDSSDYERLRQLDATGPIHLGESDPNETTEAACAHVPAHAEPAAAGPAAATDDPEDTGPIDLDELQKRSDAYAHASQVCDEDDEADALAALANDDGVSEVEAPSQESLTSAMPPLDADPDITQLSMPAVAQEGEADTPPVIHRVTRATSTPQDHAADAIAAASVTGGSPADTFAGQAAAASQTASQAAGPEADADASPSGNDDAMVPADLAGSPAPEPDSLDHIEQAAMATATNPSQTMPFAPVKPTSRDSVSASTRLSGAARSTGALAWGSRTDVGRVREHNEDSYLVNFPLFAVADGMGGHAAGEVASTIAVSSLAEASLTKPDPDALGAAIEAANIAVLDGVDQGIGRPGMGTTCTAVIIDGTRMAVGHVGDSRAYLLHEGKLLRVTHDHSFVEELVEAGEITPEEARVHPSRSIITRALGSERSMKADSFLVDVTMGDRVLLCSDGLSSMISDDVIEEAMVTSPAPQACADRLVDLALGAGGLDNVTVIVIDVKDDGIERHALLNRVRNVTLWLIAVVLVLLAILAGVLVYADHSWYLADKDGYVTLYKGVPGQYPLVSLSEEVEQTSIRTSELSEAVEERLSRGISFGSEDSARAVLERYRAQLAGSIGTEGTKGTPGGSQASDGQGASEGTPTPSEAMDSAAAEPSQDAGDGTDETAVGGTAADGGGADGQPAPDNDAGANQDA